MLPAGHGPAGLTPPPPGSPSALWRNHTQVPTWKGVKSVVSAGGADEEVEEGEAKEEAESEWREALANTGRTYYWNVRTRETRWDKPDDA